MSDEIESLLKECLDLKDKKQCPKCYTEIEKDVKFCPNCGAKQEENEAKEVEVLETQNADEEVENKEENNSNEQAKENLEKTTVIEINPDAQDITDEEVKNAGSDD